VEEVAKLYGVHRNTVRAWIKIGLPIIDQRRPLLILGSSLVAFLQARRTKNKRSCLPGEIYCLRCREPRMPADQQVQYRALTATQGNLVGTCACCNAGMNRRVSLAKLDHVRGPLTITMPEALERNRDFSRAVLVVAPGLTVKDRLRVLKPGDTGNYYDAFDLCPSETLRQKLNQMEIVVENWHTLMPLKEADRSVVKKGAEGDEAYTRRVLGNLAGYKDLIVINDEAHHAWRAPADIKVSKKDAEELGIDLDEATRWVEGLDRIHKTRRVQRCFDLSATPFAPTGRTNTEAGLFGWVISDFGLNDAIEAGLVKTPRVVVRADALPDAATLRPKLYHLYRDESVGPDLNRRGAQPHEVLPQLVQQAYTLLGADWRETARLWLEAGHPSPPVMLTVCNRTETAARIEHYFNKGHVQWPELRAPDRTLRVDSRVLEKAELGETATADKDYDQRLRGIVTAARIPDSRKERLAGLKKEELLRELVDTVGKRGQAGQDLQKVISVAMLSEGWDAKNVTHIMGLRAFTSQLLCEQVIGRGLRRVSYDMDDTKRLFLPEYVNVFGVPLSIALQPGDGGGDPPPPPKNSTAIEALIERNEFEIRWPNILRIDATVRPELTVEWSKVKALKIDPAQVVIRAEIAPALGGAADWSHVSVIDLEKLPEEFRLQRVVFKAAQRAFERMEGRFTGRREYLLFQLVRLVEQFLDSKHIDIPSLFHQEPLRKRILFALHIDPIVDHLESLIQQQNTLRLEPVFDSDRPIGSTREMRTWYTTRICEPTKHSQVSHIVVDSGWEKYTADILEGHAQVAAWVKNDHLGFQILYLWGGSKRKFVPDFLIRYKSGKTLVLEIKGQDTDQDRAKRVALGQWVEAVNVHGGFGAWVADAVVGEAARVRDVIEAHAGSHSPVKGPAIGVQAGHAPG
jgi:type III restriction enzyme